MHTRRRVVALLGATALAGCTGQASDQPTAEETQPQNQSTDTTASQSDTQRQQLTGRELYFNWIHGEDEEILEAVQADGSHSISFSAINDALETGMASGGRNQAVANALETASQEYDPSGTYEDRHTHMLSAIHQVLEQKDGDQWDFEIDSRLDATPSQEGWMKYSRVDVETDQEFTDNGNKKYHTIRAALTDKRNHTTHVKGRSADPNNTTKRLLQQISNPESIGSLSLLDKEGMENLLDETDLDREGSYDQAGMWVSALLGGQLQYKNKEENVFVPEHLIVAEDRRESEILGIVDEYEEQGDITLRNRLREEYFNNGHDEYEASEYDITANGSVSMEKINDFNLDEEVDDA